MTKKKWFTLIEMVIVVTVISILIFIMKPFFQNNKKDYLYIESCINKVYGDMNNFMYASATSKWLYSWTTRLFPSQYIIKVKNSNTIALEYKQTTWQTGTYLTDMLTWMRQYYCWSNTYTSKFSGDFFTLTIDKSKSSTNGNTQWYSLTWTKAAFTGSIWMYLCYGTKCNEVAQIEIDTRIQMLKKRKCLYVNEALWVCQTRDQ